MKNQRQVSRLINDLENCKSIQEIDKDPISQIENALVLHYQEAWHHFKWDIKKILTFRCCCCGYRHIRKPLHKIFNPNHTLTCQYGYFTNLNLYLEELIFIYFMEMINKIFIRADDHVIMFVANKRMIPKVEKLFQVGYSFI